MRARVQEAETVSGPAWKKRVALLCLIVAGISVGAVMLVSCSNGGTATATSQAGQVSTTRAPQSSTSQVALVTTTTSNTSEAQSDLFSPAQAVLGAVYSSVVNIAVTGTAGGQTGTGIGSGVVYTSDGLILTNDHVVTLDGAVTSGQSIVVTFSDDTTINATIVGEDATHDIAAIKVAKTGLNPVKFTSSGPMQLGEWAIVIGSPLDFRNSVTLGIVSGLDRTLQTSAGQPPLTGLVQIDTPISPGNSGGGCFDTRSQLIAMPEVYLPPGTTGAENIGFGIPGDVVQSVAKALTGK